CPRRRNTSSPRGVCATRPAASPLGPPDHPRPNLWVVRRTTHRLWTTPPWVVRRTTRTRCARLRLGGPPDPPKTALGGPADPRTDHDRTRTTTDHPDTDLRTAVTASRASPPPEDQISSDVDAPGPCAEHPTQRAGPRPDGRLACVFCRALAPDRRTPGRPSLRVITGGAA